MENLPSVQKEGSFFFDVEKFEHAQRIGKMFATSTLVPDHFKNNIGNCLIALNYAARLRADPFMIMQGLYVVHGRPGIESKLAIALLNSSGKFSPLKFKFNEKKDGCMASAKDLKTGEVCDGPVVTMTMAKDEGWSTKAGSKWKTMPSLMLTYRAAMFFIRIYAPEVLLGMQSYEEIRDTAPINVTPSAGNSSLTAALLGDDTTNDRSDGHLFAAVTDNKQPEKTIHCAHFDADVQLSMCDSCTRKVGCPSLEGVTDAD